MVYMISMITTGIYDVVFDLKTQKKSHNSIYILQAINRLQTWYQIVMLDLKIGIKFFNSNPISQITNRL